MNYTEHVPCPVCGSYTPILPEIDRVHADCPRCGRFDYTEWAAAALAKDVAETGEWLRDVFSYEIRRRAETGGVPCLSASLYDFVRRDARLQGPNDQADHLVLWLEKHLGPDPSDYVDCNPGLLASVMGCRSTQNAIDFVLKYCSATGLIEGPPLTRLGSDRIFLRLSFRGWDRAGHLKTAPQYVRRAFMAMAFNIPGIDTAFTDCFRPACADAGFTLDRLTDGQGAGLIDDQLRVAIRTARFLIVDLTTGNRGAYWEAGFAEGLGRPVIYVCRENVFSDKSHPDHPHFDAGHLNTVRWSPDDLPDARRRLAATIMNTFPAEARVALPDDPA